MPKLVGLSLIEFTRFLVHRSTTKSFTNERYDVEVNLSFGSDEIKNFF